MKKLIFLLLAFFTIAIIQAQTSGKTHKTVSVVEQRSIHLNGGGRASMGGKSRTYIEVDLPENTVDGTIVSLQVEVKNVSKNLLLAVQLASLFDPTMILSSGATGRLLSNVKIPQGSHAIDVSVCDESNIHNFLSKLNYNYEMGPSVQNTTQGVIKVNDHNKGKWFLGLKNPATLYSVDIIIEVVALVEE